MRIVLFFVLVCFSATGYSQASVTATASVTILKPLSIVKEADLNFAEVTVGESNGTVVLSPEGSRSVSGGAAFPAQSGQTATAASFVVQGQDSDYTISMPQEILLSDGSRSLKVDTFTHNSSGRLTEGAEIVKIGATLHVNGNQEPGTYQNQQDLRVTVQYK